MDAFDGRFREGVYTLVGGLWERISLSLLCGCSLVYKVWVVSIMNELRLPLVS